MQQMHQEGKCEAILLYDPQFSGDKPPSHIGVVAIRDLQTPKLVQKLIPALLRSGTHAWLLLYAIPAPNDGPREALVVPVTPGQGGQPQNTYSCIERLLEAAYYSSVNSPVAVDRTEWTPAVGLSNLTRSGGVIRVAAQAMVLNSQRPLMDVTSLPAVPAQPSNKTEDYRDRLSQAQQIIQDATDRMRARLIPPVTDADAEQNLRAKVEANRQIYEGLKHSGIREESPEIVYKYRKTMDPETMKFLISSAVVVAFVRAHPEIAPVFDYSIPGAGACKAIEREVKESVAYHLGLKPRDFTTHNVEQLLNGEKVKIDKREYDGATLQASLQPRLTPELLAQITDASGYLKDLHDYRGIRNVVAHIEPANETQYRQLAAFAGLEAPPEIEQSVLGKTLRSRAC